MQLPITNKDWEKPFPGYKIVGNLYYVGTYDLAAYLIATNDGLILINSGAPGSYPLMKNSIEQLGFKLTDIKIITSTHGHWDHVGDLAEFQKVSKARVLMSERDAPVLESGGNLDYRRPEGRGIIYDPIKVDQRLKDGDKFRLGTTEVTVINTPGHTPGATSFSFPIQDGGRTYNVLIANMPGINDGVKLLGSPGYPTIVQDFAGTIARLKSHDAGHLGVLARAAVQHAHGLQAGRCLQPGALRRHRRLQGEARRIRKVVQRATGHGTGRTEEIIANSAEERPS